MKELFCQVEVGMHTTEYFEDRYTGIVACTRHKKLINDQDCEDEFNPVKGPYDWKKVKV